MYTRAFTKVREREREVHMHGKKTENGRNFLERSCMSPNGQHHNVHAHGRTLKIPHTRHGCDKEKIRQPDPDRGNKQHKNTKTTRLCVRRCRTKQINSNLITAPQSSWPESRFSPITESAVSSHMSSMTFFPSFLGMLHMYACTVCIYVCVDCLHAALFGALC